MAPGNAAVGVSLATDYWGISGFRFAIVQVVQLLAGTASLGWLWQVAALSLCAQVMCCGGSVLRKQVQGIIALLMGSPLGISGAPWGPRQIVPYSPELSPKRRASSTSLGERLLPANAAHHCETFPHSLLSSFHPFPPSYAPWSSH